MAAQLVSTPRTKYTLYFVLSKMSSISVDQLLAIQQLLSKELASRGISSSVVPSAAVAEVQKRMKKDKKESKPRAAGAWAGWTAHCPKAHAAEYESFKASSATKQGVAPLFCTQWRKEHEDEYAAFEAKWKEEHSAPVSAAASVASADSPAAASEPATKVRKPQSEETKAAAAVKRAATKAKKAAEAASAELKAKVAAAPVVPASPVSVASSPEGNVSDEEEETPDLLPFKIGGKSYLRPGFLGDDGKTTWATGDLWESKKGLRGDWAGALQEDGAIDMDAEEPEIF